MYQPPTPKDVPSAQLPGIVEKKGEPVALDFKGVDEPKADGDLLRSVVKEGKGKTVTTDMTVTADYLGMVGAYGQFWSNTNRDQQMFPEFYPGIDTEFREEVLRYVDHVVFDERGGFDDLYTSPAVVTANRTRLAQLERSQMRQEMPIGSKASAFSRSRLSA